MTAVDVKPTSAAQVGCPDGTSGWVVLQLGDALAQRLLLLYGAGTRGAGWLKRGRKWMDVWQYAERSGRRADPLESSVTEQYDPHATDLLDRWNPHQAWWDARLTAAVDPYCRATLGQHRAGGRDPDAGRHRPWRRELRLAGLSVPGRPSRHCRGGEASDRPLWRA